MHVLPPPTPMGDRTAPAPRRRGPRHPLTHVLLAAWLLLCWAGYVAFTGDQARGGLYGCEMAYMWPSYSRVEWAGSARERYSVYLYREAGVDPSTPMGTPVLFLPGNAGDFKQARSVASSAARLFFGDKEIPAEGGTSWPKPLDFFTFDFNEDFSAFHAPTLEDQARFVVAATPHILEAYGADKPSRVLLLGHSMGGVVGRLAALQMDNSTITAIVTMSSPHAIPPVAFEARMDNLYSQINSASHAHPAPLLVSICGGVSDTQIVSESCALPDSLVGPEDGFAVFTTGVPGVWTGVEHQTMVWCDQVRWRVARVLLDMASAAGRKDRLDSARKWLLSHPAPRTTSGPGWNEDSVDVVAANMSIIVQFRDTTDKTLVDPPIRIEHCAGGGCTSPRTSVHAIPRPANPGDPFPFPGEGAKSKESAFVVDVYDLRVHGKLKIHAPGTFTVVGGTHEQLNVGGSWTPSLDSTATHVALRFDRPVSSILAWRLDTTTGPCTGPPPVLHHESAAAPGWSPSYESRYYPNTSPRATLHSHISGAPFQPPVQQTHGVTVHIYQQPGCPVARVTLSLDVLATIAKAMLRFRLAAVAWAAAWVGIFLFFQLREYKATGIVPPMSAVIETSLRPGVATVGSTLLAAPLLQHVLGLVLPKEQFFLGSTQFSHVPLALLVAFWSLGLVVLLQRVIAVSVAISGRFLAPTPHPSSEPKTASHSRWSAVSLSRLATAAALLLLVKLIIPWRMAFVVLYLIQCSLAARTSRDENLSRHHLACTVLLLMTFLLPLTLPAIAVWGRNLWLNHGHPFAADHAVLPLIPVLLVVQLSGDRTHSSEKKRSTPVVGQAAAAFLAATALALGPRAAHLLLHAADAVFIALAALLLE